MFTMDYKCASNKQYGHGDIVMANGYALLPFNYKNVASNDMAINKKPVETTTKAWWEKAYTNKRRRRI